MIDPSDDDLGNLDGGLLGALGVAILVGVLVGLAALWLAVMAVRMLRVWF